MTKRQRLKRNHRAYTRTHTYIFRGCKNLKAISSPLTKEGHEELMHEFVGKIIESGLEVTGENTESGFKYDVLCRGFGKGFGVTMAAILSGSDLTLHAYIEKRYGITAEIEGNLCYLPGRSDHTPAIKKLKPVFKDWLKARSVREHHSNKRYLNPLSRQRKRKGGA